MVIIALRLADLIPLKVPQPPFDAQVHRSFFSLRFNSESRRRFRPNENPLYMTRALIAMRCWQFYGENSHLRPRPLSANRDARDRYGGREWRPKEARRAFTACSVPAALARHDQPVFP
jgi:hypothetical protein